MLDCVFTIDYEIYGDGSGDLHDLVYGPTERLRALFRHLNAPFVVFVEVAELERIEACKTDRSIDLVRRQVRTLYDDGVELALHLHPQWCNATYEAGRWRLCDEEYNLCVLPRPRIAELIDRALDYLRYLVGDARFTPLAFRAGNWLFQPTSAAASVLAERGITIDSSVFKGGWQHEHDLDYRAAPPHAFWWRFSSDVNEPDASASLVELPVYTEMVPFWRMLTRKRVGLQARGPSRPQSLWRTARRMRDFLRLHYPLKLDFCRMTLAELTSMLSSLIDADHRQPEVYRPVVAIGHTKDLVDVQTVSSFISFLRAQDVRISTFTDVHAVLGEQGRPTRVAAPPARPITP